MCCHGPSIRHADGTSECLGDGPCDLTHELHRWAMTCEDAGCACGVDPIDARPVLPFAA